MLRRNYPTQTLHPMCTRTQKTSLGPASAANAAAAASSSAHQPPGTSGHGMQVRIVVVPHLDTQEPCKGGVVGGGLDGTIVVVVPRAVAAVGSVHCGGGGPLYDRARMKMMMTTTTTMVDG
jgi:hypothetical protein